MKNSKAKNGSRSSQISSLKSIWPILLFHIEIFSLITSHKCISWQSFRNKCTSEEAKWPDPRTSAAWQSLQASFSWHPHAANINAAFCGPFLLGPTFSRKESWSDCHLPVQETSANWVGKMTILIRVVRCRKGGKSLIPIPGGEGNKPTGQLHSVLHKNTCVGVCIFTAKDDFFLSIKHDCEWQWHPGLTAVFNS